MAFSGVGLCLGRLLHGKVLAGLEVRVSQSVQEARAIRRYWGELISECSPAQGCTGPVGAWSQGWELWRLLLPLPLPLLPKLWE